jgi:hypothetical protein
VKFQCESNAKIRIFIAWEMSEIQVKYDGLLAGHCHLLSGFVVAAAIWLVAAIPIRYNPNRDSSCYEARTSTLPPESCTGHRTTAGTTPWQQRQKRQRLRNPHATTWQLPEIQCNALIYGTGLPLHALCPSPLSTTTVLPLLLPWVLLSVPGVFWSFKNNTFSISDLFWLLFRGLEFSLRVSDYSSSGQLQVSIPLIQNIYISFNLATF